MAIRDLGQEERDRRVQAQALINKQVELDKARAEVFKREATIEARLRQEKLQLEEREKKLFDSVEKRVKSLSDQEEAFQPVKAVTAAGH